MLAIAVADDHPHVAIALRAIVDKTPDIRLAGECRRGGEAAGLVRRTGADILLLDLLLEPEFDALAAVRNLRADFPQLKICLLSAHIDPTLVRDLLKAGVHGYIVKDDDYISRVDCILRDLAAGKLYLSPQAYEALAQATRDESGARMLTDREKDILRLAERGFPNPQIAESLHLSAGTVRNHLSAIYAKLGVHNRQEALRKAAELRLM